VETPGKFRSVKIIFELNYTGGVMVIVRRGLGLTSSKSEFPVLATKWKEKFFICN